MDAVATLTLLEAAARAAAAGRAVALDAPV
jgi:hypothetical protein